MNRGTFLLTALAFLPSRLFARAKSDPGNLRTNRGFKVAKSEARFGEHYTMKGVTLNTLDIKISARDTGGDLAVFEQTGHTPMGGPPLHVHPFQDEWFFVVEGQYFFRVGNDEYRLNSGDTIFLPRNVPHAFVQLSETGRMIVSYLPAGKMEAFFRETDQWTSPPSPNEIARVFKKHDMKVVGAPLKIGATNQQESSDNHSKHIY